MQKVGKDGFASKRIIGTPGSNGVPVHDDRHIGATPLSSSSLSNYYNNGDNADNDYDVNGGGIMNFIFRGGQPPRTPNEPERPPTIVHLPQVPDSMRQTDVPPTERERVEMEIIKSLVESYFKIVRKNFIDLVPKTIMYFLVNHVRDSMQNELVSELYRDAQVGSLMQEAEDIAQRRQTCVEMRELLGKALDIVNEVRDFNTFK
jgi:dynamin 1-like protein